MIYPRKSVPEYIYSEAEDKLSLFQGDIIEVAGLFRMRFKKYYPKIIHNPFEKKYAMVLSQSCDLARRMQNNELKKPNLSHVILCLIRPIDRTIEFELTQTGINKSENGFFMMNNPRYEATVEKISKLINNSEAKNLFFLPKKRNSLEKESVALLNLTYAFRTSCYDEILKNRVTCLRPEFRAKIGFLLADYYGRVATTDLLEESWTQEELLIYTQKILSKSGIVNIEDNRYYDKCKKQQTAEEIKSVIEEQKLKEKLNEINELMRVPKKNAREYFFKLIKDSNELQRLSALNDNLLRKEITQIIKQIITD